MRQGEPGKLETWEPLALAHLGNIRQLVLGGGGKLSIIGGDPGENRKPKGVETNSVLPGGDPALDILMPTDVPLPSEPVGPVAPADNPPSNRP